MKQNKLKPLTVGEAIKLLQMVQDRSLKVLIDCPYCGKGNQLATIHECVVLSSAEGE